MSERAVLISIQPKWVEKIASGEKTIEVRKSRPKLETPFKCYIYETQREYKTGTGVFAYGIELKGTKKGKGKVIGEFVCDRITEYECSSKGHGELATTCGTCLTYDEIINYCNGNELYGWHITNLKIYDKPKELSVFKHDKIVSPLWTKNKEPITMPPQSWFYVNPLKEK